MTRPTNVTLSPIKMPDPDAPQPDDTDDTIQLQITSNEREFLARSGDDSSADHDDVVILAQQIVQAGIRPKPTPPRSLERGNEAPKLVEDTPIILPPAREIVQAAPIQQPTRVTQPAPSAPASGSAVPRRVSKPRNDSRQRSEARDFVIRYEGTFIGSYRSPGRVTNRTAFKNIAQAMTQRLGKDFEVEKLDIFKPVALAFEKPTDLEQARSGTFEWFGGQAPTCE